jgi:hypothetical protein
VADRLTDTVLGLQRMAEAAQQRGDDLRYTQQQETADHIAWLDHLLGMVDKVRLILLDERKRFTPINNVQKLQKPEEREQAKAVSRPPAG